MHCVTDNISYVWMLVIFCYPHAMPSPKLFCYPQTFCHSHLKTIFTTPSKKNCNPSKYFCYPTLKKFYATTPPPQFFATPPSKVLCHSTPKDFGHPAPKTFLPLGPQKFLPPHQKLFSTPLAPPQINNIQAWSPFCTFTKKCQKIPSE